MDEKECTAERCVKCLDGPPIDIGEITKHLEQMKRDIDTFITKSKLPPEETKEINKLYDIVSTFGYLVVKHHSERKCPKPALNMFVFLGIVVYGMSIFAEKLPLLAHALEDNIRMYESGIVDKLMKALISAAGRKDSEKDKDPTKLENMEPIGEA